MRKFSFWLLAWLLLGRVGYGQVVRNASDTTSLAQDMRAAYSTLNASRLATGILLDRVPTVSGPHSFDGTASATTNTYANWMQQYWEYYQAALNSASLPTPASIRQIIQDKLAAGQLPLLMLAYRYDELRPDAISGGFIQVDSAAGRLYDGPNTSASPYQQRNLFAVALAGPLSAQHTGTVYVGSDLWLGTSPPPASLLIDLGDGQGPRYVAMNSTIDLGSTETPPTQPGPQPESSRAATAARATLGPSLGSLNTITVTNPTTGQQALSATATLSTLAVTPDVVLGLKASHTWNNLPAAAAVGWVKWGDGNTSGKFRKPVVFVEGIDFGCPGNTYCTLLTPTQTGVVPESNVALAFMRKYEAYRNGSTGWNEMVDYNKDSPAVEKLPTLRDQLTQQGYDIIFLDFSDGATHIQSNAMVLVELLDYINNPANRAPGATETIVAAASMGGQVARFALAWMEQQNLCHNSKLYVSIDSPHRGANIPLGLQYMIDRLSGVLVGGSSFDMQRDKLLRPAAQQMLVYHFSPTAASLRNQWQTWQASPGSYPSLLRKVAIADGARLGQALPGAYPGMELLVSTGNANFVGGWGDNIANSLPGAGSRGNDNVIFRFHRPYEYRWKWHYTQVNSSYPTYDQAPGGTRTTTKDAEKDSEIKDITILNGRSALQSRSDYQTFIPIISALDVAAAGSIYSPNLYYDVDTNINSNRPDPSKYAFEAYYAPRDLSEPHINITDGQPSQQSNPTYNSNNVAWLLNELRESAHNLPTVLSGTYNYGSLYRRLLPTVEVAAGGQLFINNAGLPNSGGVNTANDLKENSLEVYTSSCGSRVQVSQNGALTLGQPNDTRTASVRIGTNSLLDLRSGGVATVNAGSVLRIVRGGTLVVRRGARLAIGGQVIVEEGAYVCVEDPASIVTTGSGSYAPSPAATYYANPALGLGTLACTTPTVAPLSVSITSLVYLPYCRSNSGRDNYAQWTAAATGGTGSYVYSWELDQGYGYQPYGTASPTYTTLGICLTGITTPYVLARVTARSGTQQASAIYYASPQMVLYPNPAEESVTVANDTDDGSPQARNAQASSTSTAPAGGPGTPMHVTVYNGQGRQVFAAANVTEATLRIVVKSWPAGLYQVNIRRGNTSTRHQLSVQH